MATRPGSRRARRARDHGLRAGERRSRGRAEQHRSRSVSCSWPTDWTREAQQLIIVGHGPPCWSRSNRRSSPGGSTTTSNASAPCSRTPSCTRALASASPRRRASTRCSIRCRARRRGPPACRGRAAASWWLISDNQALPRARDLARWLDRPRECPSSVTWAGFRYRPIARERYQARLRAIEAFSEHDDFDLYGEGWEQRHPAVDPELHAAAARASIGARCTANSTLLATYRFALIYENTRFPGYVSDKHPRLLLCALHPDLQRRARRGAVRPAVGVHRRATVSVVSRARAFPGAHHRRGCAALRRCRARVFDLVALRELVRRALCARCGGCVTAGRRILSLLRGTTCKS